MYRKIKNGFYENDKCILQLSAKYGYSNPNDSLLSIYRIFFIDYRLGASVIKNVDQWRSAVRDMDIPQNIKYYLVQSHNECQCIETDA